MNESLSIPTSGTASQTEVSCQRWLDAFARGEFGEEEFRAELTKLRRTLPHMPRNVVAFLNQRDQRCQLPDPVDNPSRSMSIVPASGITARAPALKTEIGRVLKNRYVLESRLGAGVLGAVFKATDRLRRGQANAHVAIKILHDDASRRPEMLWNLRREFHRAQSLCHENIIKVYELDQSEGAAHYTMEFIEGRLLCNVIKLWTPRHVPRPDAWAIIGGLSAGLTHAHSRNVVHGSLKTRNIMILRGGGVRILDYGISSIAGDQSAVESPLRDIGEDAYASCEVLDGQPADPRADLYTLACISYELLAGTHPFQRQRADRARDLGRKPARLPGLTRPQWRALARGLSWDREDRSLSIDEWFNQLNTMPAQAGGLLPGSLTVVRSRAENKAVAPWIGAFIVGVLAVFSILSSLHRGSSAINTVSNSSSEVSVQTQSDSSPVDSNQTRAPAPVPEPVAIAAPFRPRTVAPVPTLSPSPRPVHASSEIILPSRYSVQPRQHFAEIRILRAPGSASNSFSWWTEAGSAKSGTDFVPQAPVTEFFAKGVRAESLFVKVLPNDARNNSTLFYVVVAGPSGGNSAPATARVAVVLPKAH
jgi:serine/threonine protein kinase